MGFSVYLVYYKRQFEEIHFDVFNGIKITLCQMTENYINYASCLNILKVSNQPFQVTSMGFEPTTTDFVNERSNI